MDRPTVDVVVCSRNNRDIIAHTLNSIGRQTFRPNSCFVIDGLSTDGTPEFIQNEFQWAEVIRKKADSGPAASRNIGFSKSSADYVAFVDSDVELSPDWIETQVAFLENDPSISLACGKLLNASQPDRLDAAYNAINRYGVAWDAGNDQPAGHYESSFRCLACTSAAMIGRRADLERIGGFDEAMFAIHEDSDLGWRANVLGYVVFHNSRAAAMHRRHGTLNAQNIGDGKWYLLWKNRLRSAIINYELGSLIRYGSVLIVLSIVGALLISPRKPKLRGLFWNVKYIRDTLRRRRHVQLQRRRKDSDLWFLFEPGLRGPRRY